MWLRRFIGGGVTAVYRGSLRRSLWGVDMEGEGCGYGERGCGYGGEGVITVYLFIY